MSSTKYIDITLQALERCTKPYKNKCDKCPYKNNPECVQHIMRNAHTIIEQYKKERGI